MVDKINIGEFSMDVPHEANCHHVKISIHGDNFSSSTNIPVDKLPELRDFIDKILLDNKNANTISGVPICKTCTSFNGGKCKTAADVEQNHELVVPETHTCSYHSDNRIDAADINEQSEMSRIISDKVLDETLELICNSINDSDSIASTLTDGHTKAISNVITETTTSINRAYKICETVDVVDDKVMKIIIDILESMDKTVKY
jgi:hypothetical protein